ncbi:MAG: hypothetical protein HQ518_02105, partial [Rhodopirellula sp.]|nr:hypothetical protein [Rhodopirellula sp.]
EGQGPRILVLSGSLIWAAAGAGAVVFAVGFWVGRVTTLPASSTSQEPSSSIVESGTKLPQADAPNNDVSNNDVQKDNDTAGRRSAFRGRITYQAETGERKADRGARVIVLPVERKGTAKLSTTGLRSGDQPEDQQFAATGIRTLGGDVATTDDSGEFEIKLSGSGQYYILALSNSVSRENEADAAEVEKALATYFERPAQLLGRVMHHLEEVRYSGDGVTPWDFSFR